MELIHIAIAVAVGITFLIGGLLGAIASAKLKDKHKTLGLGFASGIILATVFIEMIPELQNSFDTYYGPLILTSIMLAGVLFSILADRLIPYHGKECDECHNSRIGAMSMLGLIAHNLFEGMTLAIILSNDVNMGIVFALAVSLHMLPMGAALSMSLSGKRTSRKSIFMIALVGLSFPVGALVASSISISMLGHGIIMALAASSLIYISFDFLISNISNENKHYVLYSVIAGVMTIFTIITLSSYLYI